VTGTLITRRHAASRLRIVVLGLLVRLPLGGLAWVVLHYLLGLRQLGHDVYFVEDSDDYPSCYDPSRNVTDRDPSYGLQFAARAFERVGSGDRWSYFDAHTARWLGPCADRILEICAGSDLLLSLGCVNRLRPWLMPIPVRALVDIDPVFTQVRHLTSAAAREQATLHTAFFTFAENIGRSGCTIPDDGLPWQPTRHPIFLDGWPRMPSRAEGKFTTVMHWESLRAREHGGVRYGMKSASFGPYLDLPRRAGRILEMAVAGEGAPRDRLRASGWIVRDPRQPSKDPWAYQRYIRRSKAEFTVAKHGFVATRSGWFSERSAGYLASGRPVVVQETGFSDWLPTGSGVISFSTPAEALAGIETVAGRYEFHCDAARAIAEKYFDSRKILPDLLERAVNPAAARPLDRA
jgi:hypothetical protein